MGLQAEVMIKLKEAMKAKDVVALESLRAIKSAILLEQTQAGGKAELTEEAEMKLLQKLVKQRQDSQYIADRRLHVFIDGTYRGRFVARIELRGDLLTVHV